jgi:hypothetical protein
MVLLYQIVIPAMAGETGHAEAGIQTMIVP